jgi:MFS superfamily sulfate permease-like transporter
MRDLVRARAPLALVFASLTLAVCLLLLTGLLENLPKAVLAAVVLTAVSGLFDFPALLRMRRTSAASQAQTATRTSSAIPKTSPCRVSSPSVPKHR